MTELTNNKTYDLESRTFKFALNIRTLVRSLPKSDQYSNDVQQLIRSSGSIGANYIEANESLSKKDFYMRIKICRKEAKETIYWLKLLSSISKNNKNYEALTDEATQLMKIFGSIVSNYKV